MIFGENLKKLPSSRSLSLKDLAEELGFSFQNISKWERNESLPDIETLLAIARFFWNDDRRTYWICSKSWQRNQVFS